MASAAQTSANRSNAQKSTGPRTPEGKALVAQNAVKHGLLAQREVIPGEDPGEFALFRDRMREDLRPLGTLEGMLADRIVNLAWRLGRAERMESAAWAMLEDRHGAGTTHKPAEGDDQDDREAVLARAVVEDFGDGKVLDRLLGYERRIENSLYRTMNEIRKQRLLREVEGSEFRLQAGPDSVASYVTRPLEGGTRNTRVNAELQTAAGPLSLPTSTLALETSEETPDGITTNGAQEVERVCQTKPQEVTGDKWQVTSQEAPEPNASELPTSNVRLQTADTSCETKPICVSSSEDRVSCDATVEEIGRGRPTYEETPDGVTTNGQGGETKPTEVTCEKSQVTSQPG